MWHQRSSVNKTQSLGNEKSLIRFTCYARKREVSNLHMICNTENQAAFLEPAFWRGELGEAQFTCFLCPVMWRKLAERFFLYYCCRWHNCYIILEPFEKPVYSSVAPFPLCWIEHHVASGSTGFSPVAWEKSGCPPNFQRIRQNAHRQHRIQRPLYWFHAKN